MLRRLLAPALLMFSISACAQPAPTAPAAKPAVKPAAARPATPAPARPVPVPAAAALPSGPAPREGTDYVLLPNPQPTWGTGKIEVAEVFSYRCIHCRDFQPLVNDWKKTMPADVRWEYVPGVFGGTWDTFARAFFTAQLMGIQPQTHDKVFNGVFAENAAGNGSIEDIATMYSKWGVNRDTFLSTANSFSVSAKLTRAKQFAMRAGVDGTPTIIVNGKDRVSVTPDRGFEGMLATTDYLVARERAIMKPAAKPAPAAKKG